MARFSTYADVVSADDDRWDLYNSGVLERPPGTVLQEILDHTGGDYQNELEIPERFRKQIRDVAELTGDEELMRIAGMTSVTISLEHLRGIDPRTRIACGYRLDYEGDESERLGLNKKRPAAP